VRDALCASDETIQSTLKIAPEAATGAELLAGRGDSKLIWVYQHFHASALTRLHRLGVQDCQERLNRMLCHGANDLEENWPYVQLVSRHHADGWLSPYDVAVLSWHLKNSEVVRRELYRDARVLLLSKAAFLLDTKAEIARLRAFMGIGSHRVSPPDWGEEDFAPHASFEPGAGTLSREICEHCEELWNALERARREQMGEAGVRGSDRIRGELPRRP
jgi:hypothetical protein